MLASGFLWGQGSRAISKDMKTAYSENDFPGIYNNDFMGELYKLQLSAMHGTVDLLTFCFQCVLMNNYSE